MHKYATTIAQLIKSKYFMIGLVVIVVLQGLWYAFNFTPNILDEARHIGFIQLYSERLNPFLSHQDRAWDALGEVTREPSYLYYYLMSWPLRFIELFTQDYKLQVIVLRVLNISFFALAIYVYDKLFREMKLLRVPARISLLFLILTPAIAVLPGAVSYDNLNFLLSGLLLLFAARLIKTDKVNAFALVPLLTIVFFGAVVKYTFLALALPVLVFVTYDSLRHKKLSFGGLPGRLSRVHIMLAALFLIGLGLFIERPVKNVIDYGSPAPDCIRIIGEERCKENYVYERNINALNNKPENFRPKSLYEFTVVDWIPGMIRTQVRLNPWDAPLPVMFMLYSVALFGGVMIVLIYLRQLIRSRLIVLGLLAIVAVSLALFVANYSDYVRLGEVIATSSRYLLPVQPLFMVLVAVSFRRLLGKHRAIAASIFILVLAMFSAGGSVVTYSKTADPGTRWSEAKYD